MRKTKRDTQKFVTVFDAQTKCNTHKIVTVSDAQNQTPSLIPMKRLHCCNNYEWDEMFDN